MKVAIVLVLLGFGVLPISQVQADDGVPLKGTAFLDAEGCAKGTKGPDCVLTFQLTGKAAKLLYDGMTVKAVREECTGGLQKVDGKGLNCIKSDNGTYDCDFGYTFSKKSFTASGVDC